MLLLLCRRLRWLGLRARNLSVLGVLLRMLLVKISCRSRTGSLRMGRGMSWRWHLGGLGSLGSLACSERLMMILILLRLVLLAER